MAMFCSQCLISHDLADKKIINKQLLSQIKLPRENKHNTSKKNLCYGESTLEEPKMA